MSQTCKIFVVTDSPYIILMLIISTLLPLAKFSREKNEKCREEIKMEKKDYTKLHEEKPINF